MNDRATLLALLVAVVLLETLLLWRGGIIGWFASGPHTTDEVRELVFDWRVMLSVALVSVILWLAYRRHRLGPGRPDDDTPV
jgi:multisubunit Na+/H+ antiporter MnhB subunit